MHIYVFASATALALARLSRGSRKRRGPRGGVNGEKCKRHLFSIELFGRDRRDRLPGAADAGDDEQDAEAPCGAAIVSGVTI